MAQNKRTTGAFYELRAAEYLKAQGLTILERNYRCRSGEIDLIAKDGLFLVFVEVKYRSTGTAGYALEAVSAKKAAQVRRVAAVYLYRNRYPETTPCRFDAVGIDGEQITWLKNAF